LGLGVVLGLRIILGLRAVLGIVLGLGIVLRRRGIGKADRRHKEQAECCESPSHQTLLLSTAIFGPRGMATRGVRSRPARVPPRSSALWRGNTTFIYGRHVM